MRAAAYRALAAMDDPTAVAVLEAAIAGKDLDLAAAAIARSKNDKLPDLLVAEITGARAAFRKLKDKKEVSEAAGRLSALIAALPNREHPAADKLTLDLFARRSELDKVKGDDKSGADVVEVSHPSDGGRAPAAANRRWPTPTPSWTPTSLSAAVRAARESLPAAEVYDCFRRISPRERTRRRRTRVTRRRQRGRGRSSTALGGRLRSILVSASKPGRPPPLDPRWLDVAVRDQAPRPGPRRRPARPRGRRGVPPGRVRRGAQQGEEPMHPAT